MNQNGNHSSDVEFDEEDDLLRTIRQMVSDEEARAPAKPPSHFPGAEPETVSEAETQAPKPLVLGSMARIEPEGEPPVNRAAPLTLAAAPPDRHRLYTEPDPACSGGIKGRIYSPAMPVRQVSRDAGEYLHWSGDGQKLYWSLGPELYQRQLKDAFAFANLLGFMS